jgi:hypothetical protein
MMNINNLGLSDLQKLGKSLKIKDSSLTEHNSKTYEKCRGMPLGKYIMN